MKVLCCCETGSDGECSERARRAVEVRRGGEKSWIPVCEDHAEAVISMYRMQGVRFCLVPLNRVPVKVRRQIRRHQRLAAT